MEHPGTAHPRRVPPGANDASPCLCTLQQYRLRRACLPASSARALPVRSGLRLWASHGRGPARRGQRDCPHSGTDGAHHTAVLGLRLWACRDAPTACLRVRGNWQWRGARAPACCRRPDCPRWHRAQGVPHRAGPAGHHGADGTAAPIPAAQRRRGGHRAGSGTAAAPDRRQNRYGKATGRGALQSASAYRLVCGAPASAFSAAGPVGDAAAATGSGLRRANRRPYRAARPPANACQYSAPLVYCRCSADTALLRACSTAYAEQ